MNEKECRDCSTDVLKVTMDQVKHDLKELYQKIQYSHMEYEKRLRALEDWKLIFVTKLTVYSAIALFVGSVSSQLIIHFFKAIFA